MRTTHKRSDLRNGCVHACKGVIENLLPSKAW
jgi:hypothetical protein